ncbi:MAG: DUF1538 domain-containing protein [Candidatus Izemoplasmatales bacterium]|nr:DUF1538 domain-containing protein [Candidatus Izemoplasmatales bacterium]MDY0372562.1 DUF1538 domain-containing protein [Candidatus Izemoplasmatales bacterium]
MRDLLGKFKEVFLSVLPVVLVVTFIHFLYLPLSSAQLGRFYLGAFLIFVGLSVFLIGIDVGVTPIGQMFGKKIAKSKKIWIIAIGGLVLGILITIAEPDLLIVAKRIDELTLGKIPTAAMVISVAAFIGLFVAIGLLRILFKIPLIYVFLGSYLVILIFAIFTPKDYLAIAFDISGATTGAMTVPFVLALAVGVSAMQRYGKSAEKDSFGLIGLASAGAIISVFVLVAILRPSVNGLIDLEAPASHGFLDVAWESFIALAPVFGLGILGNLFIFKLKRRVFRRYILGFIYTYIGLTLFLFGVYSGFLDLGLYLGESLAQSPIMILLVIGFLLGVFAILAEPAVYVLTEQVNEVTAGYVSKKLVVISLALGVGSALVFNIIRTRVESFELWYLLLPGYLLAIGMMFVTPKMFIGMAFDAGGVASGPISATFIFAFSQGIATHSGTQLPLGDAFGMIALIAMTPIIMIQGLGILYKIKARKKVIDDVSNGK